MSIYTAAITLFLVLDPIGLVPVLVSMLETVPAGRRQRVIVRENAVALAVLLFFSFFGPLVMGWFGISQAALYIAGGIVLLLVALEMIFPKRLWQTGIDEQLSGEPLIVPLAIPLIAGPSALATITLLATQAPEQPERRIAALLLAWGAGLMIHLLAGRLQKLVGRRVLVAAERLMGMILVIVSVQMALAGIELFVASARAGH